MHTRLELLKEARNKELTVYVHGFASDLRHATVLDFDHKQALVEFIIESSSDKLPYGVTGQRVYISLDRISIQSN